MKLIEGFQIEIVIQTVSKTPSKFSKLAEGQLFVVSYCDETVLEKVSSKTALPVGKVKTLSNLVRVPSYQFVYRVSRNYV
jgi:hypothetical protein